MLEQAGAQTDAGGAQREAAALLRQGVAEADTAGVEERVEAQIVERAADPSLQRRAADAESRDHAGDELGVRPVAAPVRLVGGGGRVIGDRGAAGGAAETDILREFLVVETDAERVHEALAVAQRNKQPEPGLIAL